MLFLLLAALLPVPRNEACAQTEGGRESHPPSNETLRERIALLEKALSFRGEGERMEQGGDFLGALLSFKRSHTLYPDPELERKIRELTAGEPSSPRPDLQPLRDRIALLEELFAGLGTLDSLFGPEETPVSSGPVVAVPPGEEFTGNEDPDWKNYPDLPEEKAAIEESFDELRSALKEGDIERAVSVIDEDRREEYAALFAHKPEAMPSFAELLENAEMSFFSAAERADPATSTALRTSEYAVVLDGFTFYVRWIKVDGKWVLFDF
ncbi:MAG: hypothetical protein CVU63_04565 [Deltaproteobacteria bacterium HGW-Deltaproteobacteria-20]|nr:MAG: hypothetical protein CVU63_04565 [Deltaproteobacteria bacterium HGW-Deltaproteobacteria-20]